MNRVLIFSVLAGLLIGVDTSAEDRVALFGDLHLHTGYSFDAFIVRTTAGPDDTYRFSKGETIQHAGGYPIQLKRPLDFAAVTDHAEYLGVLRQMVNPESPLSELELGKAMLSGDVLAVLEPYNRVLGSVAEGTAIEPMMHEETIRSAWEVVNEAAERHNDPGTFTTFVAYEWTSMPDSQNLHRNVIFRSASVPDRPFSAFDSEAPEDLWDWIDRLAEQDIDAIAIPHNQNVSNGLMFPDVDSLGNALTAAYATQRMRVEPINEVVQIKGQSMTHPTLSPNDEFANFEIYPLLLNTTTVGEVRGSYVRAAYRTGIAHQNAGGFNPFKFGIIGSSDSHNAASSIEEDNYFGKLGAFDASPQQRLHPVGQDSAQAITQMGSGGLAGVWAAENTRDAIFEAFRRKETFATSGPRMQVRFFSGWDFSADILDSESWVDEAYAGGVSMGGDLSGTPAGASPQFIVEAVKDPDSANLERIQIVKGWLSDDGETHEQVFDVGLSDNRSAKADIIAPPTDSTVNLAEGTYENRNGDVHLRALWSDPSFDPNQHAFYYVRALEIPTPRWSTIDAAHLGEAPPENLPAVIQERAWSSPIWYTPN